MKQLLLLLILSYINLIFAQNTVYVSAENGLIVRDDANKNANRIGKFAYAEALEVLEKTETYLEIIDNGKTIEGQWYKVTGKSIHNVALSGYVFSGFLTTTALKVNIEFISYHDDADYWFITTKSNNKIQPYYYSDSINKSYLRGDAIEIIWKNKTLIEAGDEEVAYDVEWIVSTKKIKDGKVSEFRKQHPNILHHGAITETYTLTALDKPYLNTEYYIANTTNNLIKMALKQQQKLAFSVEDKTWNDKAYTVVKIYQTLENKSTTLQWLFVSQETAQIYEYDLPSDRLTEFK